MFRCCDVCVCVSPPLDVNVHTMKRIREHARICTPHETINKTQKQMTRISVFQQYSLHALVRAHTLTPYTLSSESFALVYFASTNCAHEMNEWMKKKGEKQQTTKQSNIT